MIIGFVGILYEYGLFVFDVWLLLDYFVFFFVFYYLFQCFGCLNLNFYEDGKVCVSLLGIWVGCGSEVWMLKLNVF